MKEEDNSFDIENVANLGTLGIATAFELCVFEPTCRVVFAIFAPVSGQDSCSVGPCYPSPLNISKHFNVTATQLAVTRQSNTALAWIALKFAMRPTRNVNILLTL